MDLYPRNAGETPTAGTSQARQHLHAAVLCVTAARLFVLRLAPELLRDTARLRVTDLHMASLRQGYGISRSTFYHVPKDLAAANLLPRSS